MQIVNNIDLTPLNTFGLPSFAKYYCEVTKESDLPELVEEAKRLSLPIFLLGGGSNIIFTQDYPGLIVHMLNKGVAIVEENEEVAFVEASAGEIWHNFVNWTLSQGLSGLENLSLIPGTVGAAPVQNIGAYGVEAKDCIDRVCCFDLTSKSFVSFTNAQMKFAYRDSIFKSEFKGRYIIVSVRFKLNKTFKPVLDYGPLRPLIVLFEKGELSAKCVAKVVCDTRQEKLPDPKFLGNAGSFFKNPVLPLDEAEVLLRKFPEAVHYPAGKEVKFAAGWLIEKLGLKGYQIGGAAVHNKQALVLVNKQDASIDDLLALIAHIKQEILNTYNISLEAEPVFV